MADIELVIKIPVELYDLIQDKLDFSGDLKQKDIKTLMLSIDDGIPIPKGHGLLFDERDIVNGNYEIIGNKIYELEPIIESDRGEEE